MGLPGFLEQRSTGRALAALASVALHVGVIVAVVFFGGRHDGFGEGDTRTSELVFVEAPEVDRADGVDLTPLEPSFAPPTFAEQSDFTPAPLVTAPQESGTDVAEEQVAAAAAPVLEVETAIVSKISPPAQISLASAEERASLPERLARLAEELLNKPETALQWQENGKQYSAKLVPERARDGTALERVIAEVSASDRGRMVSTKIMLKRLAFSHFTQIVDRWDPMVQLHDDVIVGRFHSNSRFNVMHDSRTAPEFLGKVTTAARSFELQATGRKRQNDIFRGGLETRARRIDIPQKLQPFVWAPREEDARVHELASDTHIRFFADGSYMWRIEGTSAANYLNELSDQPVYFVATAGSTIYVQGAVSGKILVYSPQKVVIEDNLTYTHDPRQEPGSGDYLGLVSDRYIEVAPPSVTGPGDLEIHAAIFAGRRFVVRDIDHGRSATLRIYGSLSAGSLSATEPRYATEIEYDERFERQRPPGFPFTSRYEPEDWDGHWTESSEQVADDVF
jgi:hypothetical protein